MLFNILNSRYESKSAEIFNKKLIINVFSIYGRY